MTRYRVLHRTSYRYGQAVNDAYSVACLLPRERSFQQVVSSTVRANPEPDEFDERRDVFGNRVVQLGVHRRHDSFEIEAESVVEVAAHPLHDLAGAEAAVQTNQDGHGCWTPVGRTSWCRTSWCRTSW